MGCYCGRYVAEKQARTQRSGEKTCLDSSGGVGASQSGVKASRSRT